MQTPDFFLHKNETFFFSLYVQTKEGCSIGKGKKGWLVVVGEAIG